MELLQIGTERAYAFIREKIITLALAPGTIINDQQLAIDLEMGIAPIREALKLLVHDKLVVITERHGIHVANVSLPDLEQISEMRLELEGLCARLASMRATADDLVVLDALGNAYAQRASSSHDGPDDLRHLLDLDHKFHQAVANAAHNQYLASTLERYFGLSQRLWYLALPRLDFTSFRVEQHVNLVDAIRTGDRDRAERIMRDHVEGFYAQVKQVLSGMEKQ